MPKLMPAFAPSLFFALSASIAAAQSPPAAAKPAAKDYSTAPVVLRLMAFDKNGDGKLMADELTDTRLKRLFNRADQNKDGIVTKEELMALAAVLETEDAQSGGAGGGGPGGRGPGGRGGPGGPPNAENGPDGQGGPGAQGGPDGQGGPGGPGGPQGGNRRGGRGPGGGQPGVILPTQLQETLKLTDEQKQKLADLQKDVDTKLANILTAEQSAQLKQMRECGPSRPPQPADGGGRRPD